MRPGIKTTGASYQLKALQSRDGKSRKKHDLIDQKLQDLNNDGIDRAARHRFFSVGNAGIACLSGFARRS